VTGSAETPYDPNLKSCSVCGCYLRVAIWVPLDLQQQVLSPEQQDQFRRVPNCWKASLE
jgi:hypothetical protein